MENNSRFPQSLTFLQRALAVDDARKRLAEADREPDILRRFAKRGEALKRLEEANKEFLKEIVKNG